MKDGAAPPPSNPCAIRITLTPHVRFSWPPALPVFARSATCYRPDKANYRPATIPVILLSPRMRAFSEAVGNKDLFAGRVGQNRGILPVFTLLWMKMAAALTLERMRRPQNANASHAIVQSALSARPRRPARRPAAP